MSSVEELTNLINAKGDEIRKLKADKASKEVITAHVEQLKTLKDQFKEANGGVPFDPPKEEVKKEKKVEAPAPAPEREGPSKKELNKQARKEKRKGGGGDGEGEAAESAPASAPAAGAGAAAPATKPAKAAASSAVSNTAAIASPAAGVSGGIVYSTALVPPALTLAVSSILKVPSFFTYTSSTQPVPHLPYLNGTTGQSSISGDVNITRHLLRTQNHHLLSSDTWTLGEIDTWLDVYTSHVHATNDQLTTLLLPTLNAHLEAQTYVAGHSFTVADVAVYLLAVRVNPTAASFPHVARWAAHLKSAHGDVFGSAVQGAVLTVNAYGSNGAKAAAGVFATALKSGGTSAAAGGKSVSSASGAAAGAGAGGKKEKETSKAAAVTEDDERNDETGGCPPLEGAVEGQVCTRFPPEPSGYLHIGHAKAVLLNQYYAQRYKGRLLVRFDDTNPSKEKGEFADNIVQDLLTLGVKPDSVSHTSDHFRTCEEFGRQLIKAGKAYMDNTDQETMQAERMTHTESKHRNTDVETNLALFEALLRGDKAAQCYCLRAKIDMNSVNGTMRDPVLYRFNETPHLRTGTTFKAYPTYDFACPIVDSIEGVTHALRTTEYNDRDEQYHWIQDALGIRPVKIQAFGKMNFVHTVLSKRKLTWFVEQGIVEGWFDPRFPTIQGCIRRGVNVEALKQFMLSQGASRRVITMEWDKFWAENKKMLEETAPRYMGVDTNNVVRFIVTNSDIAEGTQAAVSVNINPLHPEQGQRIMRRGNVLLIDQEDAVTYKEGEEVTFLRWGNFIIDKIDRDANNVITTIHGRHNAEATNFSKTKKVTWLAQGPDVVECKIVKFDHLISKAKLGDDEDFKNFVNPDTRFESAALADACLRTLTAGTVIQLERKGFFRVDVPYGGSAEKPIVLFAIPDGKTVKAPAAAGAAGAGAGGKKK